MKRVHYGSADTPAGNGDSVEHLICQDELTTSAEKLYYPQHESQPLLSGEIPRRVAFFLKKRFCYLLE